MKFINTNGLRLLPLLIAAIVMAVVSACSSTRHVPDNEYLLDKVTIKLVDKPSGVNVMTLEPYLRQMPNHKVLGFWKLQLGFYNMSGRDSSKWYNRLARKLGQPPVIFSQQLTDASERQLEQALINMGYMDVSVEADTILNPAKKRAEVTYTVTAREPRRVRSMTYDIADTAIARLVMADSARFTLRPGSLLDRNLLDGERALIAGRLRNHGYYAFTKEYITFVADTAANSLDVDLTMMVKPPRMAGAAQKTDTTARHQLYRIGKVMLVTDYEPGGVVNPALRDTVDCRGLEVVYGPDRYLKATTLADHCFLFPGEIFRAANVDQTYESLTRLGILRSVNIDLRPTGDTFGPDGSGEQLVDAYILMTRNKKQGVTFEVEGTNSEGDLGFGLGVTYRYRNLGHSSNLLTTKVRMNYESLSGNLSGLINKRYTEWAAEVGITFPKFMFPFLSKTFSRRVKASTELAVSGNYQERPEYTRIIAGAAWKYKWSSPSGRQRRTFDLVDINYVRLPESSIDFIDQIAPSNPLLRYSYEDHFIMRMGYTYYRTNRRIASGSIRVPVRQPLVYSIRASAETAGNLLRALSKITGQHRVDSVYKIFGIQYSQYAKAEVDYTLTRNFVGSRHSLAFHVGAGVGVPYGNSRMIPFEKRFYAGGANGVRGWSVRSLGPGSYRGRNNVTDFINQCGDIRLDLSVEYRAKLFWVFEGAIFADAGNIWTIHNYPNQPGGMFHFNSFIKQLAAGYGLGLRLDFEYFLLRFDLGLKAHNPAEGEERWPLLHPRWKRDATFHFAVGYPF